MPGFLLHGSLVILIVLFDAAAQILCGLEVKWKTLMWCAAITPGGMLGQIKLQIR